MRGIVRFGFAVVAACALVLGGVGCGKSGDKAEKKREITVIAREESSGTRWTFDEVMDITDGKTNMLFDEAVLVSSTDEAAAKVEVDREAIGYMSIGALADSKVKALAIDGVAAEEANVKNGTYKIHRPFTVAVRSGENLPIAADFIGFIASKEGQAVVVEAGYIEADNPSGSDYKPAKLKGKLLLSGSTSMERVMERLKEKYEEYNPDVKVEANYTWASAAGIKDCIGKKCDIALCSRELKPEEKEKLTGTIFAYDGVAVIVNVENGLTGITSENITKIFKGEIRYWNDLTAP